MAVIDNIEKQMNRAISKKDVNLFYLSKLQALHQLSKTLGFYNKNSQVVDTKEFDYRISLLHLKGKPFYFYIANALILDLMSSDWRKSATIEVIGRIVDRNSKEVNIWRKLVLQKDGYKCVDCESSENLQAHHILEWYEFPEGRVNIENGICLCGRCHHKRHPEMGEGMFYD